MMNHVEHPAGWSDEALLADCRYEFVRRSGPGGQHRNKVATGVIVRHLPTGLSAEANERRSQSENRKRALWRLRLTLALELRMARPLDEVPSPRWQRRLVGQRVVVSPEHADFPALLAEALDLLAASDDHLPTAAVALRCSRTQIVRLLQGAPAALAAVNARRQKRGLSALR